MRAISILFVAFVAISSCGEDEQVSGTGGSGGSSATGGDAAVDASGGIAGSLGGAGSGGASGDAGARTPLDPLAIPKFQQPLVVPPVMPATGKSGNVTEYEITARQFEQQILPDGLPKTTVWGYGKAGDPATLHSPAFTIETRTNDPVRVKWINELVDAQNDFVPHFLPIDPTLEWANPPGPIDSMGTGTSYLGPVPLVAHLHGGHSPSVSDGHPQAWFLPNSANIPTGYVTRGTHFGTTTDVGEGAVVFEYPNDQRASTLWYHDHALGLTRLNVYAGLAGFYLVRDAAEDALGLPGPAPKAGDTAGARYYEIPIAIQDRSFFTDGSLRYPASRQEFDGYAGPYLPDAPVHPVWNPEVFGDTIMVNGRTWPYLEVEPRLYRLRLLNGCNARTLRLAFDKSLPFVQIGNEGGLLANAPVPQTEILLGPAERADVIVDLSTLASGEVVKLLNRGPDEPFKGVAAAQEPANPATTGLVLELRVVAATGGGTPGAIPATLPAIAPLTTTLPPRDLTLNELVYETADIPIDALLGTLDKGALTFMAPITEKPLLGDTETWRIINLTEDAHPIHLHLVMFQVVDRIPFDADGFAEAQELFLEGTAPQPTVDTFFTGAPQPPNPWEKGWKDTVIANPGEVTRIIATFDLAGLYVWHCHILEHEDNEMMRSYEVLPK